MDINKKQLIGSLIIIAAIALFFTLFFAVKYSDSGNIVKVKAGDNFTITLESNITTGYKWKIARPLDTRLLKLLGSKSVAPENIRIGAPGKEEWVFKAIRHGKTIVSFDYTRPWEEGAPAAGSEDFFIIIDR